MGAWRREHEGLRNTLARTRQEVWVIVEQLERCEGVGRASRRGNRRLAALERFLTAHFAREEGRGYLAEALAAAPRYQNRARRLCAQHGELLREIREIRELALQAHLSAEGWTDVYQAYDAFTERLVLHDEAENEIMARAVLDDLGPGD
jgi:iron-sulfur cluster repair protein YtfE (RIC family)